MTTPYGPPMAMDPLVALLLRSGGGPYGSVHEGLGAPPQPVQPPAGWQGDYAQVPALQTANQPGSGYLDALALALQGNEINVPTQRYKGDSGGFGVGLISGLEHGFSTSRLADMQHRQALQNALTQQAHDTNVANSEASKLQLEHQYAVALKAAPDSKSDEPTVNVVGPDGKTPAFMTRGEALRTHAVPFIEGMQKPASPGTVDSSDLMAFSAPGKFLGRSKTDPEWQAFIGNKTPTRPAPAGVAEFDPVAVHDAMVRGDLPADPTGYTRGQWGMVTTAAAHAKDPQFKAREQDYAAVKKWQSQQNSTKFQLIRGNISAADQGLTMLDNLSSQVGKLQPRGPITALNKLSLGSSKFGGVYGQDAQNAATNLLSQAGEVRSLLASIYMGSNAPTDQAFKQAQAILDGNWDLPQLKSAINLARQNLAIRSASMNTRPVSAGGGETLGPMFGPGGSFAAPAPPPAAGSPLFGPPQSVADFGKSIGATPRVAVPAHTRKAPTRGR